MIRLLQAKVAHNVSVLKIKKTNDTFTSNLIFDVNQIQDIKHHVIIRLQLSAVSYPVIHG